MRDVRRLGVPYMETLAKDPPQKIKDIFRASVCLIGRRQGKVERGGAKNKHCSVMRRNKEGGRDTQMSNLSNKIRNQFS